MRILVVDDHELVRMGLRPILLQLEHDQDPLEILEAENYSRALELAARYPDLDLVLLDLGLPNVVGLAALIDLRERHADLPVVILSATEDRQLMLEAFDAGAAGFIPKTASSQVMLNALRLVLSGGLYIPPATLAATCGSKEESSDASLASSKRSTASPASANLTERQQEVLALVVQGKTNKAIGRELCLAEGTVKNHVAAILRILNVDSRTQAVISVSQRGLIPGLPSTNREQGKRH